MKRITLFAMILAFIMTSIAIAEDKPLRNNSVFDETEKVKPVGYVGEMPGENKLLPRGYPGAPPQIPHDIEGITITSESNDCLMCHDPVNEMEAPFIPKSHMKGATLDMKRFACNLCHVPQANTTPLVVNENDRFIQSKK